MNSFSEAMSWVEQQHSFPPNLEDFHARRFSELARRSELFAGLPPLVVVAGSCGKASTARFLACMLQAAGLRVGLGTKPPLSETPDGHRERYQLFEPAGETWISPELFTQLAGELLPHTVGLPPDLGAPAPYDLRAWILLRAFASWGVDVGIIEANIGLRDDPAGAIPAHLTVFTPIATDHAQMLLPSASWEHLGQAAGPLWHKLSACPSPRAVVGRQPSISAEQLDRLLDRPGPRMGRDFFLDQVSSGLWGGEGRLRFGQGALELELGCLGEFQVENAATAAMAFFELRGAEDTEAVREGARRNQIPGRLQVLSSQPLELLCVASSRAKVEAMLDSLESLFAGPQAGMVLVLSLLDRVHGKEDVVTYLALHPRLRALVVTECFHPDGSRDVPAVELARLARGVAAELVVLESTSPEEAAELARRQQSGADLLLFLGNGLAAHHAQAFSSGSGTTKA